MRTTVERQFDPEQEDIGKTRTDRPRRINKYTAHPKLDIKERKAGGVRSVNEQNESEKKVEIGQENNTHIDTQTL